MNRDTEARNVVVTNFEGLFDLEMMKFAWKQVT